MRKIYLFIFLIVLSISVSTCNHNAIKGEKASENKKTQKELFLNRIKAQNCDGSKVEVTLPTPKKEMFQNMIAVSGGTCVIFAQVYGTNDKEPVPSKCEFLVDKKLEFVLEGDWDGKCSGARHKLIGVLEFYDYEFSSDPDNPLVFMMTDKGYQYIEGKGKVQDLKNSKTFILE